jgi:hypothetical protein
VRVFVGVKASPRLISVAFTGRRQARRIAFPERFEIIADTRRECGQASWKFGAGFSPGMAS